MVAPVDFERLATVQSAVAQIDDATVQETLELEEAERVERRFRRELSRNTGRRTAKCGVCGRFKPRPSSECDFCGDIPGTVNGDPREYDGEHGWHDLVVAS